MKKYSCGKDKSSHLILFGCGKYVMKKAGYVACNTYDAEICCIIEWYLVVFY